MIVLGKTQQKIMRIYADATGAEYTEEQLRQKVRRKSPIYKEINSLINAGFLTYAKYGHRKIKRYYLTKKGIDIADQFAFYDDALFKSYEEFINFQKSKNLNAEEATRLKRLMKHLHLENSDIIRIHNNLKLYDEILFSSSKGMYVVFGNKKMMDQFFENNEDGISGIIQDNDIYAIKVY